MMKRLPIWYKGSIVRYSKVDVGDYDLLKSRKWYLVALRGGYARQSSQQALNRGESRYLHRVILQAKKGWDVDHYNHDPLDNQRANLRLLKRSDNVRHRKGPQKNNKVGVLGVYWNKAARKWYSRMSIKGRILGKQFKTLQEAKEHALSLRGRLRS